jgi:DNA invertase Pin-like site-specific DNA recombinase
MHTVTTTNTDEMTSAPDLPTDPESGETIPILRDQIDAIDTAIARLVAERVRRGCAEAARRRAKHAARVERPMSSERQRAGLLLALLAGIAVGPVWAQEGGASATLARLRSEDDRRRIARIVSAQTAAPPSGSS